MKPFEIIRSTAVPIDMADVDTDQLLPARFLKQPRSVGYRDFFMRDRRFDSNDVPIPSFPLNDPKFAGAQIIIAAPNFGCGSSREGAVYALVDYGIQAVVGTSFGQIFFGNALKNGLLPVILPAENVAALRESVLKNPAQTIEIDLAADTIRSGDGLAFRFEIPQLPKACILSGQSELEVTLQRRPLIGEFEKKYFSENGWAAKSPLQPIGR